jgi:hypothetical protein
MNVILLPSGENTGLWSPRVGLGGAVTRRFRPESAATITIAVGEPGGSESATASALPSGVHEMRERLGVESAWRCRSSAPEEEMSISEEVPLRSVRQKAIREPSGDQAGWESKPSGAVNSFSAPPVTALTQMRLAPASAAHVKATRLPSGENAGVDSDPGSAVKGTTLIGGDPAETSFHTQPAQASTSPATPIAGTRKRSLFLSTFSIGTPGGIGCGMAGGGAAAGSVILAMKR